MEQAHFLRGDEWAQTVGGDVEMSDIDVAGDNLVEVAGELCGHLAGSGGDVVRGCGKAAVRVVIVVDGLIEGLVIVWACGEIVVPVFFIVFCTLEKIGGIFGGAHSVKHFRS